jgi:alcohol dehydrogenase
MLSTFRFRVSTNLRFGPNEALKLGDELKELGLSKPAAVVDHALLKHPHVQKTLASVPGIKVFACTEAEPSYDYLEAARKELIGGGHDSIVGIGGGSAMDLAKGVATILTNSGPAISYRGFPKLPHKPLPVIEIPTTAGTGSEVTFNAVFTDAQAKKKLGINSYLNFPAAAIVDPMIMVDCPKSVSISSGVDALVHTLESYVHKNHTPISRLFSKEAFRLLFNNLRRVCEKPQDVDVRAALSLGAYHAAMALMNSGSGPSGAFSYPLGAVYKVPHGYAGGAFLPSITRLNVDKGYDFSELHDLIEDADTSLSPKEKSARFADELERLFSQIGVPMKLSHYKLGPQDIQFMIDQYDVLKAAIDQNPLEITKDDVRKMMEAIA